MALIKVTHSRLSAEPAADRECNVLMQELYSEEAAVRRAAARDLVACPQASEALLARLKIETLLSVRETIITTLIRLGDAAAAAGLIECLRSDDAALRNEAIEAMKQLPEEVAPLMEQLLDDVDADVRIFAVNVLESMRHPRVEEWLIEVIRSDPHVNVCSAALDVLSEVGTMRALEAIERVQARFADDPYIQFAANLTLARLRQE
ncbi:HEAT repeat domain-containing protein [Herbaspirillum seropedicae]|jgi:HEAT repeat protein|uniref:HEAT repeat protein n=1 Tax=Herbaspirillum seropedicae (strain SmR1) TaxID=757424 RepID=D8IQV3_HERSS|nr:HEAT repeat domain-containing protein [Herbaspirillum seropedicae]ADJ63214.1 HEAT repeat protein [Herbaspirillum seropedicae SmR1]AKN65262.1 PBS lyase [Herbaspirillum seropedicae]NQE31501.1 PBS lyase [Herbaspirillum seropedicae]UMU21223.1 HEAT repeat domain-containing protein [Herbaspirillum seropedicae]